MIRIYNLHWALYSKALWQVTKQQQLLVKRNCSLQLSPEDCHCALLAACQACLTSTNVDAQ